MLMSSGRGAVPITFLVDNAYGGGGVARTVANVANHLAQEHPVRVISFHRGRKRPRFALDPSIELTVVRDLRAPEGRVARSLAKRPSRLKPTPSPRSMSLLTDLLLRRAIRGVRSGVLITTRPSLHLASTAYARRGVTTIGWDHLNFPRRHENTAQFKVLSAAIPKLDAFAVLTHEDAEDYHRALPDMTTEIAVIHNSVSWPTVLEPAPLDNKVVVAAGRLVAVKGFKRLVRAFQPVARDYPGWELHIYGRGRLRRDLKAQISELGLDGRVRLMGYSDDIPGVFAASSVYAMGSKREGFPMVLIEAMSAGLPLVAFDCPRGPAEIIDDGRNGLLVPDGDRRAMTKALRTLIEDAPLRKTMGAQALVDARQYTIEAIVEDWQRLFARLDAKS